MKKILSYIILACVTFSASAQDGVKHEFVLRGAAGMSSLNYTISQGTVSGGFGAGGGLAYNFFFNQYLGLGTGLEFGLYNAKASFSNLQGAYTALDKREQETFTFQYALKNFEEQQSAAFLTIPLLLNYRYNSFYASAGLRIAIPLSTTYKQTASQLQTSGSYPDGNTYGSPPVPEAGFITTTAYSASGSMDLKTSCMLSLEAGWKWTLADKWRLYTGLYFDYGLNDIQGAKDKNPVQYQSDKPAVLLANSVANSHFVQDIHTLSFGLRLGLAFGKSAKK